MLHTSYAAAPRYAARRGFTLVQILIVLGIIGLLSAVLFPVFNRSRATARRAQCDVKLKSISLALDAFRQENGRYPSVLSDLSSKGYLQDPEALHCPADPRENGSYADFYIIRAPNDPGDLPVVTCPFHEDLNAGAQAHLGRFTTQFATKPATLTAGNGVQIQTPGKNALDGYAGQQLRGGDRITTGAMGRATITFADGSVAELDGNADVTLLQSYLDGQHFSPLYTVLRQVRGAATYTVNHGSRFDVTTPAATAGARGTQFKVTVNGNTLEDTQLEVIEGKVFFTSPKKTGAAPEGSTLDGGLIGGLLRFLFG